MQGHSPQPSVANSREVRTTPVRRHPLIPVIQSPYLTCNSSSGSPQSLRPIVRLTQGVLILIGTAGFGEQPSQHTVCASCRWVFKVSSSVHVGRVSVSSWASWFTPCLFTRLELYASRHTRTCGHTAKVRVGFGREVCQRVLYVGQRRHSSTCTSSIPVVLLYHQGTLVQQISLVYNVNYTIFAYVALNQPLENVH